MNIVFHTDFPFPEHFRFWGGTLEPPIYLKNGLWLLAASGSIDGNKETFGAYLFTWDGGPVATMIGKLTNGRAVNSRAANMVFVWAVQGGERDVLKIFRIEGAEPAKGEEAIAFI